MNQKNKHQKFSTRPDPTRGSTRPVDNTEWSRKNHTVSVWVGEYSTMGMLDGLTSIVAKKRMVVGCFRSECELVCSLRHSALTTAGVGDDYSMVGFWRPMTQREYRRKGASRRLILYRVCCQFSSADIQSLSDLSAPLYLGLVVGSGR